MKMIYKEWLSVGSGMLLVILLLVLSTKIFHRFDCTDGKLFTLTHVTKNLYKEIPQPLIINYYVTGNLETVIPDIEDIKNMLHELSLTSHGKIRVNISEPKVPEEIKELEKVGIVPVPFKTNSNGGEVTLKIYSGIKIQFLNRIKVIPELFSSKNLEYEIVSKIREIIQNRRRVIGILIGDSSKTWDTDYTLLNNYLSRDFDLKIFLPGTFEISAINVLIVIGNTQIDKYDIENIKNFIGSGGNVLFAVDGVKIDLGHNLKATPLNNNTLLNYLQSLGIEVTPGLVVDPFSRSYRIPKNIYGGIAWQTVGAYPLWIHVTKAASITSPVTAHFTRLDLLWASPLSLHSTVSTRPEVLIDSSTLAWLMKENFNTNPYNVSQYIGGTGKKHQKFTLAAELSRGSARIIVVGDSDFLSNLIQYSDSYYNLAFVLNCVDWLSQNDDFMSIRTRHDRDPFLNKVSENNKKTAWFSSEVINLFLIPLIILILAVIHYFKESKKK